MSCTLSLNSGSVESWNASARCGCHPKAGQIRRFVLCDSPTPAAIARIGHWGASFGAAFNRHISWPAGRCSPASPSIRSFSERRRHFPNGRSAGMGQACRRPVPGVVHRDAGRESRHPDPGQTVRYARRTANTAPVRSGGVQHGHRCFCDRASIRSAEKSRLERIGRGRTYRRTSRHLIAKSAINSHFRPKNA